MSEYHPDESVGKDRTAGPPVPAEGADGEQKALGRYSPGAGVPLKVARTMTAGTVFDDPRPMDAPESGSRRSGRKLWLYRRTALITLLAVAGPAVAMVWMLEKPGFEAIGQVRVRPIIPRLVFNTGENGTIPFYEAYLNTQVAAIQSPTVLEHVLARPDVRASRWYRTPGGLPFRTPPTDLERLKDLLHVEPRGQTEIIDISARTRSGQDSATIVNAVLEEYLRYVAESVDDTSDALFRQLVNEDADLAGEIESIEQRASAARKALGTGEPSELVGAMRLAIDQTRSEMVSVRRKLDTARWRQEQLRSRLSAGADTPLPDDPAIRYGYDVSWVELSSAVSEAREAMATQGLRYGQAHPRMRELAKRLDLAAQAMSEREAQLDKLTGVRGASLPVGEVGPVTLEGAVQEADRQVEDLSHEYLGLDRELSERQAEWQANFDKAESLQNDLRLVREKRDLYKSVHERLTQKRMERNVPAAISVLARAAVPAVAARDRRVALTALALFLGSVAGMGLAAFRSGSNPLISQADQLLEAVPATFLGHLPRLDVRERAYPLDNPHLAEGIRMVRTALLQRIEGKAGAAVLITSAEPRVGKSTLAVMLARSLALCGKHVLLVDCDLRHPALVRHLHMSARVGLADVLSGTAGEDEAIVETSVPGLSVLPGLATKGGVHLELIANGVFAAAMGRWRAGYDVVVLDSAPVLPVADTRILARHVDGTVMVAWAQKTRYADLAEAVTYLNCAGGKLWGAALIETPRKQYRGYPHASTGRGATK
jgi:capsular exopolysaccharide synthesis family protein